MTTPASGRRALPTWRPLLGVRDRTLVMGVVNVTPDSFSDGGEWFEPEAALAHGRDVLAAGADIIDVGASRRVPVPSAPRWPRSCAGSSRSCVPSPTREPSCRSTPCAPRWPVRRSPPGARRQRRLGWPRRPGHGASVVAAAGVPYIAMHWRGHSADMQSLAVYDDVVDEVCRELASRRDAPLGAGLAEDLLVLDPGLGFAKTPSTTGRCWRRCRSCTSWATRSFSVPRARPSSAGWAEPRASRHGPRRA